MSRVRNIYFDQETQKVRWTTTSTENFKFNYIYVGHASENEFNILVDLLWYLHEDNPMTLDEFQETYQKLRYFCDEVMGLIDES
mgnify:CR=1 FL=1